MLSAGGWIGSVTTLIGTLGGTFGGIWFGNRLARQKSSTERVARLRDEYVSAFLSAAYTNLRFLSNKPEGTEGNPADFAVLGMRAGLYVGDEAQRAIEEVTRRYTAAYLAFKETGRPQGAEFQPFLDTLRAGLRQDLQHEARRG